MKGLIVVADDFGMSASINRGIATSVREGIVTFISFMPSGEAFRDASRLAAEMELEEMGAHLALSETVPVSDPSKVRTLLTKEGRFYPYHNEFLFNLFLGRVREEEVYLELKAQLEALKGLNIRITNLSSHEHIHMVPAMLKIFIRLAKEYDIPSIRYPRCEGMPKSPDIAKLYRSVVMTYFERGMAGILPSSGLAFTDHFRGFLDSGRLSEGPLLDIIGSLKEGTSELVCHPGYLGPEIADRYRWHAGCETELSALTSQRAKEAIEASGARLIGYKDFLSGKGR